MERIKLTDTEKAVLRMLDSGKVDKSQLASFSGALHSLEMKQLVTVEWHEGMTAADAKLTLYGKSYIQHNPKLRNPINWALIGVIAGAVTVVAWGVTLSILTNF